MIAAWEEPCGYWGIKRGESEAEIRGVLYSQNILREGINGRLEIASRWMPGPDLKKEPMIEP